MRDDVRRLHHKRATRNKTGLGIPKNHEGANGDIRVAEYLGDIYIFAKYNNRWYHCKMTDGFIVDTSKK